MARPSFRAPAPSGALRRPLVGVVLFVAVGALVAGAGWAASASMRATGRTDVLAATTSAPIRRGLVTVVSGSVPNRTPVTTVRSSVPVDQIPPAVLDGRTERSSVATATSTSTSTTVGPATTVAPTTTEAPSTTAVTAASTTPATAKPATPVANGVAADRLVTGVGDSIMFGASGQLKADVIGQTTIDAKVGRSFAEGLDVVKDLVKQKALGDVVIVHLGTNNGVTVTQLRSMLDRLKTVPTVLLVNVRVPRDWQDSSNKAIATVARSYRNVRLVDWFSATDGHPDLFASDGYHLTTEGSAFYATLIADAANY